MKKLFYRKGRKNGSKMYTSKRIRRTYKRKSYRRKSKYDDYGKLYVKCVERGQMRIVEYGADPVKTSIRSTVYWCTRSADSAPVDSDAYSFDDCIDFNRHMAAYQAYRIVGVKIKVELPEGIVGSGIQPQNVSIVSDPVRLLDGNAIGNMTRRLGYKCYSANGGSTLKRYYRVYKAMKSHCVKPWLLTNGNPSNAEVPGDIVPSTFIHIPVPAGANGTGWGAIEITWYCQFKDPTFA